MSIETEIVNDAIFYIKDCDVLMDVLYKLARKETVDDKTIAFAVDLLIESSRAELEADMDDLGQIESELWSSDERARGEYLK